MDNDNVDFKIHPVFIKVWFHKFIFMGSINKLMFSPGLHKYSVSFDRRLAWAFLKYCFS